MQQHNEANFRDLRSRITGWQKHASEVKERTPGEGQAPNADLYDDIAALFNLIEDKVNAYQDENQEVQQSDVQDTRRRLKQFREVHHAKRIPKNKLQQIDNLTAVALMGMINGSTDEEFNLILRDHILR